MGPDDAHSADRLVSEMDTGRQAAFLAVTGEQHHRGVVLADSAADIGLRVVIARRSAGISRALYDSVVAMLHQIRRRIR
ncbi:hypothetical protein AXK56_21845 [Tsukamurella pulmonis]|uniref:hypothetical protein n=1 Tax=Tsukamurella pulmonis TaxID=47312 RepID=UPI00079C0913|nr:hypothetical protein [Tsukamurella pulmonis]KXO94221.1 hypothetical protein AXK56_21845 [Tsukamurella pulmonis]